MTGPRTTGEEARLQEISGWLVQQGLEGTSQEDLLNGYCDQLFSMGVPLMRVHVAQRAYHPVFGGIGFNWSRDKGIDREAFARVSSPTLGWVQSPLHYLLEQDISDMRVDLTDQVESKRFPFLLELRERGGTDYFAAKVFFAKSAKTLAVDPNNTPEGLVISWTADKIHGFSESNIALLRGTLPVLGLALKSQSNRQMASDLLSTYLGRDAGSRVLSGDILRGSYETMNAVVMYFDLQGFTKLTEKIAGQDVISLLNCYFGEVVPIVEANGGNVLKFMGDGLLAIFDIDGLEDAHSSAVLAAIEVRDVLGELNERRQTDNLEFVGFNLALHAGAVSYGNIGGENRLDFTVIGSAVNSAARILGMCNPLDRNVIVSAKVANAARVEGYDLLSLGPFLLKGVSEPQELFAIHRPSRIAPRES